MYNFTEKGTLYIFSVFLANDTRAEIKVFFFFFPFPYKVKAHPSILSFLLYPSIFKDNGKLTVFFEKIFDKRTHFYTSSFVMFVYKWLSWLQLLLC